MPDLVPLRVPAIWRFATVLVALVLTTPDGSARYSQPPSVREDLDALIGLLQQKVVDRAAVAKRVTSLKTTESLDDIMAVYKPTKSGGIGYDPAKKGPGDGIEKRLIELGTKK